MNRRLPKTVSFKEVEGVDRYQMTGITAKGRGSGIKPLVRDYRKTRLAAKSLMAKLCGKKQPPWNRTCSSRIAS